MVASGDAQEHVEGHGEGAEVRNARLVAVVCIDVGAASETHMLFVC